MIYDIIVGVLLIGMMFLGYARGFFGAAMHAISWVAAIAAGVFACSKVSAFIGKLFLNDMVHSVLEEKFGESSEALDASVNSLPELIRSGMVVDTSGVVTIFTAYLTKIVVMVLTFLAIVFVAKLILRCIVTPIVARRRKGVIGSMNKMFGTMLGFLEGLILIYLFLAVLMLLTNLGSPEMATSISADLADSHVAGMLYNNNILLFIARGLI